MTQPFILRLNDNVSQIDFLSSTYKVMDGGFDIGLPSVTRNLAVIRPGFYVPIQSEYAYREAKLNFQIVGATRGAVISALNDIERMMRNVAAQSRLSGGRRAELQYAWEGSTQITYFEVYGGDVAFPTDVLSVAKVQALSNGNYVIDDVQLSLQLSANGYGISLFSNTLIEVPLWNPSCGGTAGSHAANKRTGGVVVKNPSLDNSHVENQYHYVEIDKADLVNYGSQPLITKITLKSDTPYSTWNHIYMGLQQAPFPTKVVLDSNEAIWAGLFGETLTDANAMGGNYRRQTWAKDTPPFYVGTNPVIEWPVDQTLGAFFIFFHAFEPITGDIQVATGLYDSEGYGVSHSGDFLAGTGFTTLPLGFLQIPPSSAELQNFGTISSNLHLGLYVAGSGVTDAISITLDYVSALPVGSGLRILKGRGNSITGTMIDDGWRGIAYQKNEGTGVVSEPFYGLLEPLKLEPNITQRIYFTSGAYGASGLADRTRSFKVQVHIVPTYLTLAL